MRPSRGMGAVKKSKNPNHGMNALKSSNKGLFDTDEMPKAKTLTRKDDPDRVKFYSKGGKRKK